jgi:hypothetical protein
MTITGNDYDALLKIAVDNAVDVADSIPLSKLIEARAGRDDEFHDRLFAAVLSEVDDFHPDLSKYEAADISEVCGEVENDILHGDILGRFFEED